MTTLRVHFDGHVFIHDEPVDLSPGSALEIHFSKAPPAPNPSAQIPGKVKIGRDPMTGLPMFISPPGSPPITLEDVKRAEEDEF